MPPPSKPTSSAGQKGQARERGEERDREREEGENEIERGCWRAARAKPRTGQVA